MLDASQIASGFDWTVTSTGVYDEDYGVTYLRFTHELKTNILKDDKIVFDLGFTDTPVAVGGVTPPPSFVTANLKDTDSSRCIVY